MASYFIMHPALHETDVDNILQNADKINEEIAEEDPTKKSKYQSTAWAIMKSLERYANQIQLGPEYSEILEDLEDRIMNTRTTPSAKLMNYVKNGSLTEYALTRAKRYQEAALESINPFRGFESGKVYTAAELRQALSQE